MAMGMALADIRACRRNVRPAGFLWGLGDVGWK